jgi:hypothetical protein
MNYLVRDFYRGSYRTESKEKEVDRETAIRTYVRNIHSDIKPSLITMSTETRSLSWPQRKLRQLCSFLPLSLRPLNPRSSIKRLQ